MDGVRIWTPSVYMDLKMHDQEKEIKTRYKMLSDGAKSVLKSMLDIGKKSITIRQFQVAGYDNLKSILFSMYELESRGFGVVSGESVDSTFTLNSLAALTIRNL